MTAPMTVTRIYKRAFAYFREDAGKIALSAVLIVLSTLAAMLQPFPLMLLVNSVMDNKEKLHWSYRAAYSVLPENGPKQIAALAAAALVLRLTQEALQVWQGALKVRISYNGLLRVRRDLFRQFQRLSLAYHRSHPQGDAINRIVHNTSGVQSAFNLVQGAFVNVATLLVITVILLAMNVRLALVALSVVPLLVWVIRAYGNSMTEQSRRAAAADAEITTGVQQAVALVPLVQSYGREETEYRAFNLMAEKGVAAWA